MKLGSVGSFWLGGYDLFYTVYPSSDTEARAPHTTVNHTSIYDSGINFVPLYTIEFRLSVP